MKNKCWLNPVQQTKQNIIIAILAITACFLGAMLGVLSFGLPNTAYADSVDNDIVNFNQLILNDYIVSHTYSSSGINDVMYAVMKSGHVYYIKFDFDAYVDNTIAYRDSQSHWVGICTLDELTNSHYSNIFTCSVENAYLYVYVRTNSSTISNFVLVDLTQMGIDDYTLQQCNDLFVAPYYNYNSGTAVSLSGLDSYSQGVQSVYDTLTYNYVGEDSYNLLESYAFYRGSTYYNGAPSKEQSHISVAALDGDGWSSGNGFALYYPFTSSLSAGDTITLNGMLGSATDLGTHQLATTYIIIRYGDNIYDVLNVNSIVLQDATTNNVNSFTYTLPSDATGLVFYSIQPFRIKDFTIQVKSLSINNLIDNAYKNGVEKGSNAYQVGNNGYNAIYEAGRQQGIDDAGNYTFLGLISAVVDTPINAVLSMLDFDLLGVNMKAFYLSLFTFCIIVFIVKLII